MATATHQGRKAIADTGDPLALASAQEVQWLICTAPFMNKGFIFVGSSTVTGAGITTATTDGYILAPGASTPKMGPCDLAEVYIEGKEADCVYWMAGSGTSTAGLTVVQATAANLNATVVQATASNLQVEPNQATAADLNATVTPAGWSVSAELAVGTNVVKASAGTLHGFLVETGGTNDITVQFYNHTSTSTTPITPSIVVPGGDNYGGAMGMDITCSVGIVCIHSGANGIVTAYYS